MRQRVHSFTLYYFNWNKKLITLLGLNLTNSFLAHFDNSKSWKPSDYVAAINSRPDEQTFMAVITKICKDETFEPLIQRAHVQAPALQDSTHDVYSLRASAVIAVFRLLKWTSKGAIKYNNKESKHAWMAHNSKDNIPEYAKSTFLCLNHMSSRRFREYTNKEMDKDPQMYYLGYSMEDWNRAWMLLSYLKKERPGAAKLLRKGRQQKLVKLIFEDQQKINLEQADRQGEKHAKNIRSQEYYEIFNERSQEATKDLLEKGEAAFFRNALNASSKDYDYTKSSDDLKNIMAGREAYFKLAGSSPTTATTRSREEIIADWHIIKEKLGPVFKGKIRNMEPGEFKPNPAVPYNKVSLQQYQAQSEGAISTLNESLDLQDKIAKKKRKKNKGSPKFEDNDNADRTLNSDYLNRASNIISSHFAREQYVAGKPPPEVDYSSALALLEIRGANKETLNYNIANTMVTKEDLTEKDAPPPKDEDIDLDAVNPEDIIKPPFQFKAHQPVGMLENTPSFYFLSWAPYFNWNYNLLISIDLTSSIALVISIGIASSPSLLFQLGLRAHIQLACYFNWDYEFTLG